ncbi:hypothetical protein RZR18_24960, partial [Escherichia coli]|uniref:hypothetical protein n=1 Tax=Escherichia coli TaxID=562 RepID=UPI00292AAE55
MKLGKRFIKPGGSTRETLESFLERKFAEEDNFVLRRTEHLTILAADSATETAVTQTFRLCLGDGPSERAEMENVVTCLAQ